MNAMGVCRYLHQPSLVFVPLASWDNCPLPTKKKKTQTSYRPGIIGCRPIPIYLEKLDSTNRIRYMRIPAGVTTWGSKARSVDSLNLAAQILNLSLQIGSCSWGPPGLDSLLSDRLSQSAESIYFCRARKSLREAGAGAFSSDRSLASKRGQHVWRVEVDHAVNLRELLLTDQEN